MKKRNTINFFRFRFFRFFIFFLLFYNYLYVLWFFLNFYFSVLKVETVVDGAKRKCIVKNITKEDSGNYICEVVGTDSRVSGKLTISKSILPKTSTEIQPAKTIEFARSKKELRLKDIKSNKAWVRCPVTDYWMKNPNLIKS